MQVHETITNVFAVIFSFLWPHVFFILSLYGAGSSLNVHLFGLEQGTKCILYAMCLGWSSFFTFDLLQLVSGPRDASTQPPGMAFYR